MKTIILLITIFAGSIGFAENKLCYGLDTGRSKSIHKLKTGHTVVSNSMVIYPDTEGAPSVILKLKLKDSSGKIQPYILYGGCMPAKVNSNQSSIIAKSKLTLPQKNQYVCGGDCDSAGFDLQTTKTSQGELVAVQIRYGSFEIDGSNDGSCGTGPLRLKNESFFLKSKDCN